MALQQTVQVVTHVALLIFFSVAAGRDADLSHFVPKGTTLYLIAGIALGAIGTFTFIPKARRWLRNEVRPQLTEVLGSLTQLARNPGRFMLIVLGSAGTHPRGRTGVVGQRRGVRRRHHVRHGHDRHDDRRHPGVGRAPPGGVARWRPPSSVA